MSVGVVIVSHSEKLAEGVAELAGQMAQGRVVIAAAGGMPDGGLGTSLQRVQAAIAAADSGEGCIILYDLGGARLTAEFAVETLTPEEQARVRICTTPLVEGAVAAAVEASIGGNLASVSQAALAAAIPAKATGDLAATAAPSSGLDGVAQSKSVLLTNRVGLHARPASLFVQMAAQFAARISLSLGTHVADGKRILSILQLGARCGDELTIKAQGPDSTAALAALVALVQRKFDEPE